MIGLSFFVGWLIPVVFVLTVNLIVLVLILQVLQRSTSVSHLEKSNGKKRGRICLSSAVLLGLIWLFGILTIMEANMLFQYIFCFLVAIQGIFLFIFHCVRRKDVRSEWKRVLGMYKTSEPTQLAANLTTSSTSPSKGRTTSASVCSGN